MLAQLKQLLRLSGEAHRPQLHRRARELGSTCQAVHCADGCRWQLPKKGSRRCVQIPAAKSQTYTHCTCLTSPLSRLATNTDPSSAALGATAAAAAPPGSASASRCHRSARHVDWDRGGQLHGLTDTHEGTAHSHAGKQPAGVVHERRLGTACPSPALTSRVEGLEQPGLRPRLRQPQHVRPTHSQRRRGRRPWHRAAAAAAALFCFAAFGGPPICTVLDGSGVLG